MSAPVTRMRPLIRADLAKRSNPVMTLIVGGCIVGTAIIVLAVLVVTLLSQERDD